MKKRDWLWLLAINAIANIAAHLTLTDTGLRPAWVGTLTGAWPGFVISTTISTMCALVIPSLTRRLSPHRYWSRWAVVIPTLIMLAIVGSIVAVGMLTLMGYVAWAAFRLRFDIDVGDDVGDVLVPRLALQTRVENSVKYAVSPLRDGGRISVTAQRNRDKVRLEVLDNGPGFDLATAPDGHGLALIQARLRLLHGDAAALAVSRRDERTRVSIELPANAS